MTNVIEEKEAFRLYREEKTVFTLTPKQGEYFTIKVSSPEGDVGYIRLMDAIPWSDLGSTFPKPGYLFVDHIDVKKEGEGYGYLLYRDALMYARENRFKGLVSSTIHRSDKASNIWNRMRSYSSKYYDYVDVKELDINMKEPQ